MNQYLKNLNKIEFVVTYACTGRCKHCSEGDHTVCGQRIDPEIAADAVRKIGVEYEIHTVMTFGGEPLLYPDAVYAIMKSATGLNIPKRQVITNGYFSKNADKIREVAEQLALCGVNDLLLSVDAFHQETIPLDVVKHFAAEAKACGIPIRLQPAWLVSPAEDNPYNRKTREILNSFVDMGVFANLGNVIFPEGNALKYLAEYFTDEVSENPYVEDPCDVRCISFEPNGGVLGGNVYENDIMEIIRDYAPKMRKGKSDMIKEIIELLPSTDCKAKIKEINHQFKESELLAIIYTYAPSFDARLDLLGRFAEISSPDISALARAHIEYEQETFARFIEAADNVAYELHIKTSPEDWEDKFLCASYHAALVCIDRFYEKYADINVKETEQTRYRILKRKIFSTGDKFNNDAASECVLGPNKKLLEVSDYQNYFESFCEQKGICPPDSDDVVYPCFAKDLALIHYTDYEGKKHFGINLCMESCKKSCGLIDLLYVLPLDGTTIRDRRFDDDFYDHEHIAVPEATLASPEDLDETMRTNYFNFISFWIEQNND